MIQNVLGLGTLWMALIWNFLLAFVVIPALSILAVGRLSLGYVVAIGNYALFGIFLGTSSFTVVRSGPSLPSLSVYGGTGPWEIAAYVLVAAAVANRYRFRQESWLRTATDRISEPPERLSTRHWATLGMALTLIVVTAIAEGT